jgi:hypothetical protein
MREVTVIEVGVEFTLQELGVLANLLQLPTAAGIEENPIEALPDEVRSYVVDSVLAGLEARQVVTRENELIDVADPVKAILVAASVPGVVSIVSRQVNAVVDTTFLSVTPDLGVEVSAVAHTVYRLTPFAPSDLLARVLRLSDLHPMEAVSEGVVIDVSQEALDLCAQRILDGDDQGALDALGAARSETEALMRAIKAKRSSSQVTILHKPGEGRVEGGAIAWLDGGFRGIWTIEAIEDDDGPTGMIRIASGNSTEIARELFSYLPSAFSEEDPLASVSQ